MIHGTPHSPRSNIEIILPAPLASGLHQTMVVEPQKNLVRTPSFVDQWVSAVASHEPDLSGLYAVRQKSFTILMPFKKQIVNGCLSYPLRECRSLKLKQRTTYVIASENTPAYYRLYHVFTIHYPIIGRVN